MTTMQPRTENKVTRSHPMHCDVIEFEDRYELNLDLPGFQKEEIRISVEDSNLTVEAAHSAQENTGKMLRNERYTGPYARSFHIGKDIDCENAGAAYTDGVLKITLRKIRKVPATIDIQ